MGVNTYKPKVILVVDIISNSLVKAPAPETMRLNDDRLRWKQTYARTATGTG